jgi:hypothetical protein
LKKSIVNRREIGRVYKPVKDCPYKEFSNSRGKRLETYSESKELIKDWSWILCLNKNERGLYHLVGKLILFEF